MENIPDLTYYPDDRPGITRRRAGRGWSYRAPDGTRIEQKAERRRLDALAVPPAYEDVWICPKINGHLQATGRDTRARKQYRYHEAWTAFRARRKFGDLAAFGEHLPAIRRSIRRDLHEDAGERAFAVAAVLAMIDRLSLRVGNRDYAEENGAYGATTLRSKHLKLEDGGLRLAYTAKGGQKMNRRVDDKRLAKVLHDLDDLPGATLVTWQDGETTREVTSSEVNETLAEITGAAFTAKTFRTWNGSVAALERALKDETLTIKAMSEAAATRLGNTPTIARNSYVHPDVIDLAGTSLPDRRRIADTAPDRRELRAGERALLHLLTH